MTTEQRRALANATPTTDVIRDAVTFPRDRLGEPLDISPERFEAWLARVRRDAKAEALREAAREEFQLSPNIHYHGVRVHKRLVERALRIERGDSDEHR